jgi:hypothetical protein
MAQILQKNNLGDHIPKDAKNKTEDQAKQGTYHALIAIKSSHDAWILDLGVSHNMAATKNVLAYIFACMDPPILMGDDTPIEVIG